MVDGWPFRGAQVVRSETMVNEIVLKTLADEARPCT